MNDDNVLDSNEIEYDVDKQDDDDDSNGSPPPLPKTLPPTSNNSSYRLDNHHLQHLNHLNENTSLANNKIPLNQLPILDIHHQTPPTPKSRFNNESGSNNNITLSSASYNGDDGTPIINNNFNNKKNFNVSDHTTSAHEFLSANSMRINSPFNVNRPNTNNNLNSNNINNNNDNYLYSSVIKNNNNNVYSPSNAEARRNDPGSNINYNNKLLKQQPTNNISNNHNSNLNNTASSNSNTAPLGSLIGGIKVLPDPVNILTVK